MGMYSEYTGKTYNLKQTDKKEEIKGVFDSIARAKTWEGLYGGKADRLSYNFVSRQRAVKN